MRDLQTPVQEFLDQIPNPDTLRAWIAESVRRTALLRSLLPISARKAAGGRQGRLKATPPNQEVLAHA